MAEIKDVIEYVMSTPTNSNPAVLRSMLEDLSQGTTDINIKLAHVQILYDEADTEESMIMVPCMTLDKTKVTGFVPIDGGLTAKIEVLVPNDLNGTFATCLPNHYFFDCTGDAVIQGSNRLDALISGNCTLTVKNGAPK